MNNNYMEYVKLGINHHMLNKWVINDPVVHYSTMQDILKYPGIDVIDLWITDNVLFHEDEVKAILSSGKEIVYNIGGRPGKKLPNPSSLNIDEQKYAMDFFKHEIDMAMEIGSKKIVIFSGEDTPRNRSMSYDIFKQFCMKLCEYVPVDVVFVLEPADRDIDKKMLIGPTDEAANFVKSLNSDGYKNIKLMIDMCHVPLLNESLEKAMNEASGILGHLHIGNSIKCNKGHKFYGDSHPPFGIQDSIYTEEDAAYVISRAIDMNYLSKGSADTVTFEMVGYDGLSWKESADIFLHSWELVWGMVLENLNE